MYSINYDNKVINLTERESMVWDRAIDISMSGSVADVSDFDDIGSRQSVGGVISSLVYKGLVLVDIEMDGSVWAVHPREGACFWCDHVSEDEAEALKVKVDANLNREENTMTTVTIKKQEGDWTDVKGIARTGSYWEVSQDGNVIECLGGSRTKADIIRHVQKDFGETVQIVEGNEPAPAEPEVKADPGELKKTVITFYEEDREALLEFARQLRAKRRGE